MSGMGMGMGGMGGMGMMGMNPMMMVRFFLPRRLGRLPV